MTQTATAGTGVVGAADTPRVGLAGRILVGLPETLPVAVAGFTLPAMVLLLLNSFTPTNALWLGLLVAVVAVAALVWPGRDARPGPSRGDVLWSGVNLLIVAGWMGLNSLWTGQDLYATRDPATYGLAGRYLVDHQSLHIPAQIPLFGNIPGLNPISAGFAESRWNLIYAQGNHGTAVLLAVAYKFGGSNAYFRTNVVLGGVVMIALFGIARKVVPGWLACVAVATLGFSLPWLYVTRDFYSEPLCTVLLLGGIVLFWRAVETGRFRDYKLAGFVLASSALARVDSYAALLAVVVALSILLAIAPVGKRRAQLVRTFACVLGAALPLILGYQDVAALSSGYFFSVSGNVHHLVEAGAALAVLGAIGVVICWRTQVVEIARRESVVRKAAITSAVITVAGFAFLASRPLWQISRQKNAPPSTTVFVSFLQKAANYTIDPTRTYYEHTVAWLGWNYGWPVVVLGVIGYGGLVYRLFRTRDRRLLLLLGMAFAMSALYLWNASIVPDQTWAMRRFVPVIIPGLLIAAVYAISLLGRYRRQIALPVMAGLSVLMIVVTAYITDPMYRVRADVPQLTLVRAMCSRLPANAAVFEMDGAALAGYGQTVRSWCDRPSMGLTDPKTGVTGATTTQLAQIAQAVAKHGDQLYVLGMSATSFPMPAGTTIQPFATQAITKWPEKLEVVPQNEITYSQSLYLGKVAPDGSITVIS